MNIADYATISGEERSGRGSRVDPPPMAHDLGVEDLVERHSPCGCLNGNLNSHPPALNIGVVGARGGHGTTTVAAVLAIAAADVAPTSLIATEPDVTATLLGLTAKASHELTIGAGLVLGSDVERRAQVRIEDLGALHQLGDRREAPDVLLAVLRGPCYLGVRAITSADRQIDGIVVLAEAGRSLTGRDVADVTGIDVIAQVPVTPSVARSIDAGLLLARHAQHNEFSALRRWLHCRLREAVETPPSASSERTVMIDTDLPVSPNGETGRSDGGC